ncbi:BMP family ABC transporter substrate-binding protein [Dehalobacter sp. DCM]|uniref:BMP family ABC transporter substrate-binding protein n=1 Tax=Dehalobacter sp. DCM TaxID=2907827 RepID=UPI003081F047|nr:BMP family ABC transporter substrate-binding protein [Dehalobacter sp. DCM]
MKRRLTFIAVLVVTIALALSGCGTAKTDDKSGGVAKDKIKIGFIYVGPANDGGWTQAHDNGRKYMVEQLGLSADQTVIKEIVNDANADSEQVMRDMIDQGCNIIFATSFGYASHVEKIAKEYPDVKFYHCSGYIKGDNISTYFGRMYEPRYLSGIVAGLKTKTDRIGYAAAFETPEVISGINAFALGVKSVNPDAKIIVKWTHTWIDAAQEKAAAVALLNDGCDVISQHNDSTSPQVAAEQKGAYAIGYNIDNPTAAPKAYMTAPIWNWGPYYQAEVQSVIDGSWKPSDYHGGMAEGILDLAPLTAVAPTEAKALVDDAKAKIKDGSLQVFAGEIKDQAGNVKVEKGKYLDYAQIMSTDMNWFVDNVEGVIEAQ